MCESGTKPGLPTVWWWGLNLKFNGEMYDAEEAQIFARELLNYFPALSAI